MAGFTPTFNAFKNLANWAQINLEKLVAKHKKLAPEARVAELREQFQRFQQLPQTADAVEKMTTFLTALNKTAHIAELAAGLQQISTLQTTNKKFEALKALFAKDAILQAFAKCWNTDLQSQSSTMQDMLDNVLKGNCDNARKAFGQLATQTVFDPTKKLVGDLLRAFLMLFDLALVSAGHQAVFVPNDAEGEGARDPKTGFFRDEKGMHPPQ